MGLFFSNRGVSETEWTESVVSETRRDPWGLWAIVKDGRSNFGLSGAELEAYVRRTVVDVVSAGAHPVLGDRATSSGWRFAANYGVDPQRVADALISEWRQSGGDPDEGGVWFAFPRVYEKR